MRSGITPPVPVTSQNAQQKVYSETCLMLAKLVFYVSGAARNWAFCIHKFISGLDIVHVPGWC